MKKRVRPVTVRFSLVQPKEAADIWTDPELMKAIEDIFKIWARAVDGELLPYSLYITVSTCEPD